ncbi:MAG: protein kinase domain-containing protein [Gemmatimonadales bacterium]
MSDPQARLATALADRYTIQRELGAGGMATVYLAQDLKHDRKVAVKVLRPDLAAALGPERFLREVKIAANLQHPHVLPLYDSGQVHGFLFYVMPFVDGVSLREKLVKEGELPIPDAVRILRDVADAMAYAHSRGVVHRDIKPENIMLSGRHALVTDFGVAKAVSEATGRQTLTTAGVALGTPTYMSPEQAAADPQTDHRADLYAFGVVAYELLAGLPPFVGATPQAVLAAHVTIPAQPVTNHRASIPPALAALVMRCLEKKPADRWQSAEELIRQLEAVLTPSGGMTPTATQPVTAAVAPVTPRRWPAIMLAGALALALAAGGVWWLTRDRIPLDPNLVVVAPFENRTGDAQRDPLGSDLADRLTDVIARKGVTQPVPSATVRELLRANAARTSAIPALLSARSRAGLTLVGTISSRGDSLEYRVEVLRQPGGTPIGQAEPVIAADPAGAVDELGERVAILLAANRDWGDDMKWGRDFSLPGTLDAYRAFVEALNAFQAGEWARAISGFDAALALAPGWRLASIWRALAVWDAGAPYRADSSVAKLVAEPGLLPGDRAEANRILARLRGEWDRAYALTRDLYGIAPKTFASEACFAAAHTARPQEAADYARHLQDTTFWTAPTRRNPRFPACVNWALHGLGRYREQLEHALSMRRDYPNHPIPYLTAEIEARAALHQPTEVERLLGEAEGLEGSRPSINLSRATIAGRELRAHGDSAAALRAFGRAATWNRRRLDGGDTTFARVNALMMALQGWGRWDEVRSLLPLHARLATSHLDSSYTVWNRAILEARTGNRGAALDAIREFERLRVPVPKTPELTPALDLALVYSALGDTTQALVALRKAYGLGDATLRRQWVWHRQLDRYILEHPAFKQLVRAQP